MQESTPLALICPKKLRMENYLLDKDLNLCSQGLQTSLHFRLYKSQLHLLKFGLKFKINEVPVGQGSQFVFAAFAKVPALQTVQESTPPALICPKNYE